MTSQSSIVSLNYANSNVRDRLKYLGNLQIGPSFIINYTTTNGLTPFDHLAWIIQIISYAFNKLYHRIFFF